MTAAPTRETRAPPQQEDVNWGLPSATHSAAAVLAATPSVTTTLAAASPEAAIPEAIGVRAAAAMPAGGFAEAPPGFADAAGFFRRPGMPDVEQLLRDAEAALRPMLAARAAPAAPVHPGPEGEAALRMAAGAGAVPMPLVPERSSDAPAPDPAPSDGTPWDPAALRRQLLNHGFAHLGDEDLAALLLGLALPADPRPLARAAVRHFGSFAALLSADERALRALRGFGPHAIAAVRLIQAAAIRLRRAEVMREHVLDRWDRVIGYLTAALARERVEQFRVLFLDAAGRLLADEAQARGTVNHTPVYPREVARRALELDASGLILVHNHPSGDPAPSREDRDMTAQVREAVECLGLQLVDHVIIGNGRHTSFRAEGLL